jgi:hypothetical protein
MRGEEEERFFFDGRALPEVGRVMVMSDQDGDEGTCLDVWNVTWTT